MNEKGEIAMRGPADGVFTTADETIAAQQCDGADSRQLGLIFRGNDVDGLLDRF